MRKNVTDTTERLIRVQAPRRGALVELRVQYAIESINGRSMYRLVRVEDPNKSTSTD